MLRAGANRVFSPYTIAGRQMALSALHPIVVEFIERWQREKTALLCSPRWRSPRNQAFATAPFTMSCTRYDRSLCSASSAHPAS